MPFCSNLVSPEMMSGESQSHRFFGEADALSLYDSTLPLLLAFEEFYFLVAEFDYETLGRTDTPTRALEPQDVLRVWQLFEMAARDYINHEGRDSRAAQEK